MPRASMLTTFAAPLAAALSLQTPAHRLPQTSRFAASPLMVANVPKVDEAMTEDCTIDSTVADLTCGPEIQIGPPFKKIMAANRAEIAVRIMRAATELNMETVAIYGYEDRYSQHRWGADQSFMLKPAETAVKAYLDVDQVVKIAKENGVVRPAVCNPELQRAAAYRRPRAHDAPAVAAGRHPPWLRLPL